jgi:hypothetical protein
MIEWRRVLEKDGAIVDEQEGYMTAPDAFANMAAQPGTTRARVSTTVSRSLQYGEVKVSFTLSVDCPQEKQWMDYASRELFSQAVSYVNSGMGLLVPDLPPLNVPLRTTP